ncbi:MAG: nuclear transport factor 2 family protein [Candidatus Neomarinimicrobiota bacterium]
MNKFLLNISAFAILFLTACVENVSYEGVESAGKRLGNEDNELYGNAYVLGSDKSVNTVMEAVAAYNALDAEKEMSFYSDDYVTEERMAGMKEWHGAMESLNMNPWAVVPIRLQGDNRDLVLVWSVEERVWKNGSKQTQDLFEVFPVNDDGKINGFSQWRRNRGDNEFGLSTGGKFIGRNPENEYSGRPLVFSNRGETEVIEQLVEAYNSKDVEGFLKHFADEWQATDHEGNSEKRNKADAREMMQNWFDESESIEWKPWSIVPLKIYDTDPLAGVTVYSTEKRVGKDGSVWEKKLVEWFYFDIDGKIQAFDQYAQDIKPVE